MPKRENSTNTSEIITYRPAALKHNAHGWSVEYFAFDPAEGRLKRHAVKLNVLRKQYGRLSDFKAHCNTIRNLPAAGRLSAKRKTHGFSHLL